MMSGECDICGEHCLECICPFKTNPESFSWRQENGIQEFLDGLKPLRSSLVSGRPDYPEDSHRDKAYSQSNCLQDPL